MGLAASDSDDVCQEVFLVAHRKLSSFRGDSSPRTWLYGIAMKLVSDHRKRTIRRKEDGISAREMVADAPQAPDGIERQQTKALFDKSLMDLDEPRRAVFVLYEIEDLSLQEIATCLDVPLQTVYSRLKSARTQMQAQFRAVFDNHVQTTPAVGGQ